MGTPRSPLINLPKSRKILRQVLFGISGGDFRIIFVF